MRTLQCKAPVIAGETQLGLQQFQDVPKLEIRTKHTCRSQPLIRDSLGFNLKSPPVHISPALRAGIISSPSYPEPLL